MSYSCRFHQLIQRDFDEAFEWYESREKGLGERFLSAVRNKIDQITVHPESFGRGEDTKFREATIDLFPFVIVFKVDKRSRAVLIVSIHHTKKNPQKRYRR